MENIISYSCDVYINYVVNSDIDMKVEIRVQNNDRGREGQERLAVQDVVQNIFKPWKIMPNRVSSILDLTTINEIEI